MKKILSLFVVLASGMLVACSGGDSGAPAPSGGGPAGITIMEPKDGAKVPANKPVMLKYEAKLSAQGDHLHISVDGGKPDIVNQLKGTQSIGPLTPGKHTIKVAAVTGGHSPTGNEASITITAE